MWKDFLVVSGLSFHECAWWTNTHRFFNKTSPDFSKWRLTSLAGPELTTEPVRRWRPPRRQDFFLSTSAAGRHVRAKHTSFAVDRWNRVRYRVASAQTSLEMAGVSIGMERGQSAGRKWPESGIFRPVGRFPTGESLTSARARRQASRGLAEGRKRERMGWELFLE